MSKAVTRRQLLTGAGSGLGGLLLAGLAGYEWPHGHGPVPRAVGRPGPSSTAGAVPGASVQSFVSRPDLRPPGVTVTHQGTVGPTSPRFVFLSPRSYVAGAPGQAGLMVVDRSGRLVWFKPSQAAPFDFNVQEYRGRPVLTWWQGEVVYDYGVGTGEMASSSYMTERTVQAGAGLHADLHELQLTSAGTALVTAYEVVAANSRRVGARTNEQVVAGHVQEIDLATGKVLFDWDSLSHVGLEESLQVPPNSGQYDYFHINSIAEMPDGDLLVSARNTCALYKVDRSTGRVIWRMNGKRSDFKMAAGTPFFWQHDARPHGTNTISLFDDRSPTVTEPRSRAVLLDVDTASMEVTLRRSYLHSAAFVAANQGNTQVLPDGRVFVGWGNQPYFTEFSFEGKVLLDGELPLGFHSYRAYCLDWEGAPSGVPDIAARRNPAGGSVVYASWNGATNVDRWDVLAGTEASSMTVVGSQKWAGFETPIAVNATGPYFAVAALDVKGAVLRWSAPAKLS